MTELWRLFALLPRYQDNENSVIKLRPNGLIIIFIARMFCNENSTQWDVTQFSCEIARSYETETG